MIKVISSTPRDPKAKSFAFANTNLLANVAPDSVGKVTKGGIYRRSSRWSDQDGLLVPEMSRVAVVTIRK